MRHSHHNSGFSLVELSIVLVILGLLVGGILGGQSLIRAAELRNVVVEYQNHRSAFYSFRQKYHALPGDMRNATRFWGVAHADFETCIGTASTDTSTCDGNGDGRIGGAAPHGVYERFLLWKHLANAGVMSGAYTGIGSHYNGTTYTGCIVGLNCPVSRVGSATWQVTTQPAMPDDHTVYYPASGGVVMYFGAVTEGMNPHFPVLTTEEAWGIDAKMDDGSPATGFIRTYKHGTTASFAEASNRCADDADPAVAQYDFSISGIACALVFLLD